MNGDFFNAIYDINSLIIISGKTLSIKLTPLHSLNSKHLEKLEEIFYNIQVFSTYKHYYAN
jgi:hypothetical protein